MTINIAVLPRKLLNKFRLKGLIFFFFFSNNSKQYIYIFYLLLTDQVFKYIGLPTTLQKSMQLKPCSVQLCFKLELQIYEP